MKNYLIYFTLIFNFVNQFHVVAQQDFTFRVTMIGTGVPPVEGKAASSILVEAGTEKMIFDVGKGASVNIGKYGLPLAEITNVFITHLHGDHVLGLPDLWLSSYHRSNGSRKGCMDIYGPVGIANMTKGLEEAYEFVAQNWIGYAKPGFKVTEISTDGGIFEDDDLKVTTFTVEHGIRENWYAFGYKMEYKGRSVVISGDTGYSENLVMYAKGTNILFHEVFMLNDESSVDKEFLSILKNIHTVPEKASKVFAQTQPQLAVAFHHGINLDKELEKSKLAELFKGDIIIANDLMSFEIDLNGNIAIINN